MSRDGRLLAAVRYDHEGWHVGFAPFDNPQYAVAVVMEEAGFGGSTAAPVARRILEGLAGKPPGPVQLSGGVD